MKGNNGFTLIEIILAIALIGIISVSFLPLMTFSYTNLVGSERFTQALYDDQELVEEQIDALRFVDPVDPNKEEYVFFGVTVPVHTISINTTDSGLVQVLLPKQTKIPLIPAIQSDPVIEVRNSSDNKVIPQPASILLLDDTRSLFVNEVTITPATSSEHLMNVYRWYTTSEMSQSETVPTSVNEYVIVHEWNEARTPVPFDEAIEKTFIPNFKEYTDPVTGLKVTYNRLKYTSIKNLLSFPDETMINNYGNRFVRYGVTPYSIAGRMGVERLSNAIYIDAPRIEIVSADFDDDENAIFITFSRDIKDVINESLIQLNEAFPIPVGIVRDETEHDKLGIYFSEDVEMSVPLGGNRILRGAVSSEEYGRISIWYNSQPNDFFTITP
jgi:prepilin-type N-terminal cleavage/methylation domain-containing protein